MVDSVKNAISRIETVKTRRNEAAQPQASAPKPSSASETDSVELKSAEMVSAARDMASVYLSLRSKSESPLFFLPLRLDCRQWTPSISLLY